MGHDKDASIMSELDAAQSPTQSAGQIQQNRRYANCAMREKLRFKGKQCQLAGKKLDINFDFHGTVARSHAPEAIAVSAPADLTLDNRP
jgi:hypothetical protein